VLFKRLSPLLLGMLLSGLALAQGNVLEDGTPVKLRIGRTVSSADAQVGDTVDFEVLEEIKVGDMVVIPKGGLAWATITAAQSKRRMARGGKLDMNIDSVRLLDGEKTALRAVKDVKGGGHTGAMTGAIVATTIVFWPAAPLFLLMHGKDITIPKGTEITAYINGDFHLDQAKLQRSTRLIPAAAPVLTAPTISDSEPATPDAQQRYIRIVNSNGTVMYIPECKQNSTGVNNPPRSQNRPQRRALPNLLLCQEFPRSRGQARSGKAHDGKSAKLARQEGRPGTLGRSGKRAK
jgi:hypothetical protein